MNNISADEFIKLCIDDKVLYADSKGSIFKRVGFTGGIGDWKELKGTIDNSGYKRVTISWKGYRKNLRAHRIICFFWNGYKKNMTIDHIDYDKLNNHPDNLRILCNEENAARKKPKRNTTQRGENESFQTIIL